MASRPRTKLYKEHVHEGMILHGRIAPANLKALPSFDLTGDILLATYPKTGTTWMQELLWLVNSGGDFESANSKTVEERFPWIDVTIKGQSMMEHATTLPHPRLLKTHMPATLFSKQLHVASSNVKVIVTIRNPKDTFVSLYHFSRMCSDFGKFEGSWSEFFDEIVRPKLTYCGDYFTWYQTWYRYKNNPNVKFVQYEDMSKNLREVIEDVAKFLGKNVDDELMDKFINHLSFSQMKDNKMVNYSWHSKEDFDLSISPFIRKGQVGDWKNYFTEEQSEYIDREYRDTLEKAGVQLQFQ